MSCVWITNSSRVHLSKCLCNFLDHECLQRLTAADVRNAIDTLMDLSLFVVSVGIRSFIVNVSKLIEKEHSSHSRQATIHDYFQKDWKVVATIIIPREILKRSKLLLKLVVTYFTTSGAFATFIRAFRGYFRGYFFGEI